MIRVLIVDDSAVVRRTLTEQLGQYPDIEVVGAAIDPYNARDLIVKLDPDVLTLDIEMPRMDGLSFLAKLMKHYPLPVVVVSSVTPENSETAIRALTLGAVEVICKPGTEYSVSDIGRRLARAVRAAAAARPSFRSPRLTPAADRPIAGAFQLQTTRKVLALGASTGGTSALEVVLSALPPDTPGTVVVQHMPEHFTAAFASRLNSVCAMEVREARDQDPVVDGAVLIAPGGRHMVVERSGARYQVRLEDGPAVHHQRPAVDVLFDSVAENVGFNAVGGVLTGMGSDGARGLLEMKKLGARTFAQDEKTSIVFGMPREAIRLGAADEVIPLPQIPAAIVRMLQEQSRARAA